ncbi:MAG: glycosyltransferase family 2 protein [Chloroflexota bacterium]
MPRVSIIVPAYNAAKYLGHTIESVLEQTCTGWELIVVDDGSSDGTATLVQQFAQRDQRIRLVQQANSGVSAARMRGFQETDSTSDFVTFLDADDVWEPGALERLIQSLDAAPAAVGAHGLARFIDAEGQPLLPDWGAEYGRDRREVVGNQLVPVQPDRPTTFSVLIFRNCIFTSGQVLLRREAFASSAGYDPALRMAEDWDLWLRLSMRGEFAFVNDVVLQYRRHPVSVGTDTRAMARASVYTRRLITHSPLLTPEQRRIAQAADRLNQQTYCRMRWGWAWNNLSQGRFLRATIEASRAMRDTLQLSMARA